MPRQIYNRNVSKLHASTNRMFAGLVLAQYAASVVWASFTASRTWQGESSSIHPHLLSAIVLGGIIAIPSVLLAVCRAEAPMTRWVVAVAQMLMCSLLIHASGGRIEAHFGIFVSLAFLSFYRDWKLFIPATAIVLVDHIVRGLYAPLSIYGSATGAKWRFLEHGGWVLFEVVILVVGCVRARREMWAIAERQSLEVSVDQAEALVARRTALLDNAMDAIISIDADGKITEFNPAAESMFQIASPGARGKPLSELIPDELQSPLAANHLPTSVSGVSKRIEVMGVRNGTEPFPIELSITSMMLNGEVVFTAFIRDIAERKQLEAELMSAQKMESIGQLAAGVAHEINTPNQYIGDNIRFAKDGFEGLRSSIRALTQLHKAATEAHFEPALTSEIESVLRSTDLEFLMEELPHAIGQAQEGVDRVASIVTAMKDFSHPGQTATTSVDINRVIESTVTVARNEWKYVADLTLCLAPDLPFIEGNPGELGQVILNLIINAVHTIKDRFGGEHRGVIHIVTLARANQLEISISDNGCGVPVHARARIFEPFFTTKRMGVGTGQGLALSRSVICDHHGGQITFETEPQIGTVFHILLPIKSASDHEPELAA